MSYDIRINFNGADSTFIDLNQRVQGYECTAQKCLVNIATIQDSDPLFVDATNLRGTTLLPGALRGAVIDSTDAKHLCNFAAVDTVFFVRANDYVDPEAEDVEDPTRVRDVSLTVSDLATGVMSVDAEFTFEDGTTIVTTDNDIALS